jgi:mRNA interferase MazF
MNILQFDIWLVNLNPSFGSEQGGLRPCIILETNAACNNGNTTLIAPITSQLNKTFTFDVIIEPNKINGLDKISKIKFRQIRVVDKFRLVKKIGKLENIYYKKIHERIFLAFDLNKDFL